MENTTNNKQIDLLTVNELAGLLRLSKISVYRLVESRQIPFYRFRGSLRFNRNDIDNFLSKQYRRATEI